MDQATLIAGLMDSDRLDEALALADKTLGGGTSGSDAHLHFLRGKILWRLGRRSEAVGAYSRAVELDPSSPARSAIEMASQIDSFFNPDMFNP